MKLDRSAVQTLLKVRESKSIVIRCQPTDGTYFGREVRIRVIKEAK